MSKPTPNATSAGKYGALIQKAKGAETSNDSETSKPESQKTGFLANQQASKPEQRETKVAEVNLSIKVPRDLRQHWVSEAKRQGTSLTAAITIALKERFGEP